MRNWGTGKLMARSGIHGCLSLHFRSQFFQCSVCYIALHFFFQSISENHDSIDFLVLLLVNPTSTVAKKQVFLENLNASTLPWLLSSSRPPVFLFLSGVCFPGLYTQGQVEWSSKSLCAPQHPDFFLS